MRRQLLGIRLDHWLVAILLAVMALIAFINILSRYIFHFSLAATEEITINLFVWMTIIGIGLAFEQGGQMGMVTFFNMFSPRVQRGCVMVYSLLAALLFLVLNYFMIQAIYDEITLFQARSASLNIPVWIYYAGLPLFSVFVFRGIYRDAKAKLASGAGGDKGE